MVEVGCLDMLSIEGQVAGYMKLRDRLFTQELSFFFHFNLAYLTYLHQKISNVEFHFNYPLNLVFFFQMS